MNLGSALSGMGRHEDGLAEIGTALSLRPNHVPSWHNRGQVLNNAGRREEADQAYARALEIDPGFIEARFGRAVVSLLLGRFAIGWREYRARRSMRDIASQYHREVLPVDLAGRHVVVERDQGLGDELFFLRFAPVLARCGARVTYLADARLVSMLARARVVDRVLAQGDDPGPFDLRLAVGDLPYVLGMGDGDPPPPSLALAAIPSREAMIAARLAAFGPGPYRAVTWRAGTQGMIGVVSKQTPAEGLARALRSTAATLVAVQRRPEPGEIETFAQAAGRPVLDLSGLNDDLEDMLALMGLVDDHVCVSNTNVHLRAARGRPSRVLVPHPPEFRWMGQGDESPWFPGSRVYRQAIDGGWQEALDTLARDLCGNGQG
jgi:hypothetical protein